MGARLNDAKAVVVRKNKNSDLMIGANGWMNKGKYRSFRDVGTCDVTTVTDHCLQHFRTRSPHFPPFLQVGLAARIMACAGPAFCVHEGQHMFLDVIKGSGIGLCRYDVHAAEIDYTSSR